ncbi:MAG: hypothetical protein ABL919_15395 [Methylococcales bacterium]|nr:hypothetical protein [Methylococcaceae bacterium]
MDLKKIPTLISVNPIKSILIALAVGAAVAGIYFSKAATTYACSTTTIDGHQVCLKYRISPLPIKLIGTVANTACPNNPPSNCP